MHSVALQLCHMPYKVDGLPVSYRKHKWMIRLEHLLIQVQAHWHDFHNCNRNEFIIKNH